MSPHCSLRFKQGKGGILCNLKAASQQWVPPAAYPTQTWSPTTVMSTKAWVAQKYVSEKLAPISVEMFTDHPSAHWIMTKMFPDTSS